MFSFAQKAASTKGALRSRAVRAELKCESLQQLATKRATELATARMHTAEVLSDQHISFVVVLLMKHT
jgi:hypothetical protein